MKAALICPAALIASSASAAPAPPEVPSGNVLSLSTPFLIPKGDGSAGLQFRAFGGADKLLYTDLDATYGLCPSFNIEFLGDFASTGTDGTIRYGGSDGEVRLRYKLPLDFAATVQAGIADAATPAQGHRVASTLGASFTLPVTAGVDLFAEPKAVILDRNSLVGLGLGASVKVASGVQLLGEWTPIISGRNAIDTQSLGRSQVGLFGVGFRFTNVAPNLSLDVAYTNTIGASTGFSLTPSIGNVGGFLIGATYRF